MRFSILILSIVSLAPMTGCSEADQSAPARARNEGWTTIRLPNTSRTEAFDAGVHAMKQWFRLEEASPVNGQIRSLTMEYDQKGGTERLRDTAIKYRNRMRHNATLIVLEEGQDSIVRCVVRVQRLDTADHRVFRDNERFNDYPNQTPIDREAGVTAKQDQVWTEMPRDKQLETDILSVVRSRVGKPPTSAPVR